MAYTDMAGELSIPALGNASISTTWTQITLPSWTRYITVKGDVAIYVAFKALVDGAAVTGSEPLSSHLAGERIEYKIGSQQQDLFVASQSGAAEIELIAEPRT